MRAELLSGLPKNYNAIYVRAIPQSTEGFASGLCKSSFKATKQAGYF